MRLGAQRLAAFGLAMVLAGCDSATVTPSPTGGAAASGAPVGSSSPGQSGAPDGSLGPPDQGTNVALEPLPLPGLTDPFDIGQSLYDPLLMPTAVVSLLDRIGAQITTDDGAVLRAGADLGGGAISLTESEVRGWIEMTADELDEVQDDMPGRSSVADLHRALSSSLPDGFSAEELAAGYQEAYTRNPSSFVAGVMLGQPIEPQTRLLRIQMWLLLVDGFTRAGGAATRSVSLAGWHPGDGAAGSIANLAPGQTIGTAALFQPPLTSPMAGVSDATWLQVLRTLPTLAYQVPFDVDGARPIHEGHGRLGDRLQLTARYRLAPTFGVNQDFLFDADAPGEGLSVTWVSTDSAMLQRHGQLQGGRLGAPVTTDAGGAVRINYQAVQERANQRFVELRERVSLTAEVDQLALVIWAYDLQPEVLAVLECQCLITGTRKAGNGGFQVGWHADEVLELSIENYYNFTFSVGGIAELHRNGVDKVQGTLAWNKDDRTWRGTVDALNSGHAQGMAVLGAAGIAECGAGDDALGGQTLYVVGQEIGNDEVLLRFYPETPPEGDETTCQRNIRFPGGGPDKRPAGWYAPLNDTRWSNPAMGFRIEVPASYGWSSYSDQTAIVPAMNVCSVFYVATNRIDPAQPYPTPTPVPPVTPKLCLAAP